MPQRCTADASFDGATFEVDLYEALESTTGRFHATSNNAGFGLTLSGSSTSANFWLEKVAHEPSALQ
jgi:hypothetical protein